MTNKTSVASTSRKTAAVNPKMNQYASLMREPFGVTGAAGPKPPLPASAPDAATRASDDATSRAETRRRTTRAFYGGARVARGTAARRGRAGRGLRERDPPARGCRLRAEGRRARLRARARAGGAARLLALALDLPRRRRYLPQSRECRRRLRGRRQKNRRI